MREEKLNLREEKKFLKRQELLEKRRKLYELGEIEECDIYYSGIVVTKTTRAKISAANKKTKRRKAINAKISASLKSFHNKIPFNQRKNLFR